MKLRRRPAPSLERASCIAVDFVPGKNRIVDVFHTTRGAVFVVTDLRDGVQSVYTHPETSDDARRDLEAVL